MRWYTDPSGAAEIAELRCAGFAVSAGDNSLRLGIAAVAARLDNGTLKVLAGACPSLLREASLYRYSDDPADFIGPTLTIKGMKSACATPDDSSDKPATQASASTEGIAAGIGLSGFKFARDPRVALGL